MYMFWVILGIVAWFAFALWPASIAKRKGYSFSLFLILGILTSFILTLIVAQLLKDKNETAQDRKEEREVEEVLTNE